MLDACGVDPTVIPTSARGPYNRAVAELRRLEVTPEQVHQRAAVFQQRWPGVSLTPTALARRWPELNGDLLPALRSTTDQRVEQGLALVRKYAELDEGNR